MINILDRIQEIETRLEAFSRLGKTREEESTAVDGLSAAPAAPSFGTRVAEEASSRQAPASTQARPYDDLVGRASRETKLPSELLHAVMQRESNYDPRAVSPKGAMGLMQLMPGTARELEVRDPFSPEENVLGGARYLRGLLDRYQGNLVRALAAYNAGPEALKEGRIPDYPETKDYVKRVLDSYARMSGLDARPAAE